MKKQTKVIIIVAIIVVAIGGYYSYQKNNFNKRSQASDKIMKDKGVKPNNTDKSIVNKILKDDDLDYAYITHDDNNVTLALKFKKDMQDKEKYSKMNKYVDQLKTYYKGKTINAMAVVDWLVTPSYKGLTTAISGKIDTKKVTSVKVFVKGNPTDVNIESDGTFSYDVNAINPGTIITIKAYDSNNNAVNSKDVIRGL
ncbi:hypothetical protein [Clostridium kluyveri]|uniref:Uncharacterized protein n=2 Tax=Clostridium kluyveri TaxID=1534 RepID=A5N1W4_CLOK5|nr:hypothetical protein [Clostridium kluyveri]EDK35110.1 Hypothetical protein CKL_3102 [Clostridium kluyveri DSM 555]BAH07795.1 hypothetical protein CKR_2744 [Clostridium kluyveri NBRC 12016]